MSYHVEHKVSKSLCVHIVVYLPQVLMQREIFQVEGLLKGTVMIVVEVIDGLVAQEHEEVA